MSAPLGFLFIASCSLLAFGFGWEKGVTEGQRRVYKQLEAFEREQSGQRQK